MKSTKTVGMGAALLMLVAVMFFCVPARSAGSLILYVRNQVYTEPTVKVNGELYASLSGFLKALRFGWRAEGNTLTIITTSRGGSALTQESYTLMYRGRRLNVATRFENGTTWVSVPALATALGAGFQENRNLNMAEVYFVAAAAPEAPVATATATATATPEVASTASASPAASTSASPAAVSSASPEAAATPSPTPQPDVKVTRNQVVPDMTNGRLIVTLEVENPADVPAKDVNVHVDVLSGEGDAVFSQNVYIGGMNPHQTITKTFDGAHPSGTSMPRSLYHAEAVPTFSR